MYTKKKDFFNLICKEDQENNNMKKEEEITAKIICFINQTGGFCLKSISYIFLVPRNCFSLFFLVIFKEI